MAIRSSGGKLENGPEKLRKTKVNLGIDYEGLEIGGENLVSQSPNNNKYMAQSIEVTKKTKKLLEGEVGSERTIVQ
mgnify:CR=1 FL=1